MSVNLASSWSATEFAVEFALQGFGEEISDHLLPGTKLNRELIAVDAIGDERKWNIEMFGSLAAWLATILFEENGALVVFMENGVLMTTSLRFEEVNSLWNDWHEAICSNQFSFGRAASLIFNLIEVLTGVPFPRDMQPPESPGMH
jgi:hypothetical protein